MLKNIIIWGLTILILFTLFIFHWEVTINTSNIPEIIEVNEEIPLPEAYFKGKIFFREGIQISVKEKYNVNTSKTGIYVKSYSANFLFFSAKKDITISVVDTEAPVITLYHEENSFTFPNEEYVEEGYNAHDNYDGDVTDKVETFRDGNIITYFVADSSGNYTSATREIIYNDNIAPEIKLIGNDTISIYQGDTYKEQGATATDNVDGNITNRIIISGHIDTSKTGTYTLEYSIEDSYKNKAKTFRTIHVIAKPIEEKPSEEKPEEIQKPNGKTIYLTFDDGPGPYTKKLLDVLDKYNIKATFFVVGSTSYTSVIKDIVDRGHSIGIHSVSHSYKEIYASEESFLNDLYTMQNIIKEYSGVETHLMRFPGGSSNTVSKNYCTGIMTALTKKVEELGFQYFDWNVSSGDAGSTTTADGVYNNVINGVANRKNSVVLQHDIKGFSVDAVERIIQWGLENGYTFAPLNMNSPTAHHGINN